MIINHNLAANNAIRNMNINSTTASKSMQKLSSGLRINGAADDAAGLAISEKMRGQIRGLTQASANAQDSISMVQTAEGALNETTSILQRMRELSVQGSNDTATDSDRKAMQTETAQLKSEIDRISGTTEFNTKKLLNGSLSAASTAQGTKAISSQFDSADTVAAGGTSKAGLAATLSSATTGTTGTGYSTTAGNGLAANTIIQTGVNDKFDIQISGHTYNATLDASTSTGFTRQQLVDATNSAIKNAVGTNAWTNTANQAVATLTSDNHLKFTTVSTGSSATLGVTVSDTAASKGATEAMGFNATKSVITGTKDLTSGYTMDSATAKNFQISLGNKTPTDIDLSTNLTDGAHTLAEVKTALQKSLDTAFGAGNVAVGDDGQGHLKLTSSVKTGTFSTVAGSALNINTALFGGATSAIADPSVANVTKAGTSTVNATVAGTYISANANDQFNLSVDGGVAQTLTLNAGNYATKSLLVTEINNQINNNSSLVGKVTAQADADGKISFVSNSKGTSSNVTVTEPTSVNQSALGVLGYAGSAVQVSGTKNLATGVELNTAGATKLAVTLGNKTVEIDLAGSDGIETQFGATAGAATVGSAAAGTVALADAGLVIKIDGKTVTTVLAGGETAAQVATKMNAAANTALGTTGETYASIDASGKFNINSLTFGAQSQTEVVSAGTAATLTDLNISVAAKTSGTESVLSASTVGSAAAGTLGAADAGNLVLKIDGTTISTALANADTAAAVVTKINAQANTTMSTVGKIYAALDANGALAIKSLTSGASSGTEVVSGAAAQLTVLKLSVGAKTGGTSGASSRDAIVSALQSKLDTAFGKGAVTVNTSTTATGVDTLAVSSNTRGAAFSIADGVGKDALFKADGSAVTANVSAEGTNVSGAGTDAVDNTLSNASLVTTLSDKDGNNLGLKAGNVIKISGTQNGDGFDASLTVTATTTLSDVENALRNLSAFSGATISLDATTGKLSVDGVEGSSKDISNLAFGAQTSATNKTSVGAFDKQFATFNVTQTAADTRSDNSILTQIGANQGQTMQIDINDMGTKALKVADIDLTTQAGAETATTVIDNAIQAVSAERSKLGAFSNRLDHTINNLGTASENLTSAESRIRDVDMASEMSNFSKNNILSQAAQAMLAQANQQPQQVLQLLR